jgi:hypothetical protein
MGAAVGVRALSDYDDLFALIPPAAPADTAADTTAPVALEVVR